MHFNTPTVCTIALALAGLGAAIPVLYQGFKRRGKGVVYQKNFVIQRAPQYASIFTIALIVLSFMSSNQLVHGHYLVPFTTAAPLFSRTVQSIISWTGNVLFLSGLIFMIGGWYSLGECFTTDAEVLDKHTVRKTGLLKLVMHPAYSGIIQSLLGASLAANSISAALFTLLVVAPLWLNRAKYEEKLMLDTFGESYKDYADELKWRRLVPPCIPIGV